jgi:hypothetical protein
MEADESTNQNPVKNKIFLWITGRFHFGTGNAEYFLLSIVGKEERVETFAIAKKIRGHSGPGRVSLMLESLLDVQGNVINHE